jgi:hypothetical protein
MPDFESVSSEVRPRARYSWFWATRFVGATIPIVIVDILDDIARDTGLSRSAVITDVLRAHPEIAAALTAHYGTSAHPTFRKVEG